MNKKIEETTEEYERKEGSGLERAGARGDILLVAGIILHHV